MNQSKIRIFLFTVTFLFAAKNIIVAQKIAFDNSTEKIADIEKKAFANAYANNRVANGLRYEGTVASVNFDVNFYRCEWEIDPNIRFIKGKVTSYFTITTSTDKIIYDLSDTLTVDSITYHGNQLAFQKIGNDGLQLQFPSVLNAGQKDSVSIYYSGVPRDFTTYRPFVQSTHNGAPIIWTLSEPFGSKEWWPCKNGLNDKADSIDILITNPVVYQASSNGVMAHESIVNGKKLSVWKHRYPIASYLVAMAVSNFSVLKDTVMIGGKAMDLIDYVYPESVSYFNSQRDYTKQALELFSKLFGDYPFAKEKYGFTQFGAGGGMEHQTNTFLNTPSIALIEHETGHQWFGDKITCGSWQDTWLNEGFASYCQVLYFENTDKNYFYLTLNALINNITSQPGGSVLVDDTTNASRAFDTRLTYYKGCYLLHMLRWKLGDDVFYKGIRRYLSDPLLQYNYAKTGDLQRNLELESGKSLTIFFRNWFSNQGYPNYAAEWMQDSNNNVYVKINQTTSHPSVSFFDMPVPIQFKNSTRDTIIVFDNTLNGQAFLANPGFKADTAIFDPLYWILCHKTIKHSECNNTAGNDKIFPYYNITWSQNTNNWIYTDISQVNSLAIPSTDNIQFYLHFSGNGRDTVLVLKRNGGHYNTWINPGFKVTTAFVTTSCLTNMNYAITKESNNAPANQIKIFPIPVTDGLLNIAIKNPSDKHLSVSMINVAGQFLYRGKFETPGKDEVFSLPVGNLAKGVYFIKLQSESAVRMIKKFIK